MLLPRLLLRADGNSHIGLGHVMRLLALAEILRAEAAECLFLLREPSKELREQVIEAGCSVVEVPVQPLAEEAVWLVRHVLRATDILVVDGYSFTYSYQHTVRGAIARLIYLDDLHSFPLAADLVLNPAGNISINQYEMRQPGARLLVGPSFAPLRTAFRVAALQPASTASPNTVLVCLGGADTTHQTWHVATALLALPSIQRVHAVVGSAYVEWEALQAWADHQPRLVLHRNLVASDLVELMRACGAAICSPSTVSYEYCAVGGGLLGLLQVADNQHDIIRFLCSSGLALPYPEVLDMLASGKVTQLASQLRKQQRQVFDGLAPVRLQQEFRALQLPEAPFYLRHAQPFDSSQLLTWTNDPDVRQHSFNPDPVTLSQHKQWFAARLADLNSLLLIAEDTTQGLPVGLIRFQIEDKQATLSYLLGAAYRGRGLAPLLLVAGTRLVLQSFPELRRVVGHVQPHNVASIKAFQRAGYFISVNSATKYPYSVTFVWEGTT